MRDELPGPGGLLAAAIALVTAGCYAPLATAAPQSPTTAGRGEVGLDVVVEYPALDLLGTAADPLDPADPNAYPTVEVPAYTLAVSYGVAPRWDLEAGMAGGIYAIIPLPHGGWLGARHHALRTAALDVGVTARAGYGGQLAWTTDDASDGSSVDVIAGSLTGTVRFRSISWVKPTVALSVAPARVRTNVLPRPVDDFTAVATTGTLAATFAWGLTPFVSGGVIASTNTRGTALVATFGLARVHR